MKKILFTSIIVGLISTGFCLITYKKNVKKSSFLNYLDKPESRFISNSNFKLDPYVNPSFTNIASKAVDAVVNVKNYSRRINNLQYIDPFEFFFDFPRRHRFKIKPKNNRNNRPTGHGSGVIISSNGYIVTNNHVIDGAEKIEVTLNNQKSYKAKIIGKDKNSDIALIKIDKKDLTYLNFADSEKVKVGEWVLAIGNPFSLNSTVTAGIVSAKSRNLDILKSKSKSPIESFIQTDAAINPGNSGGALININGDLIGINTAIASKSGIYIGYGFAVPSNLTKKVIEDIKKFGIVQRAYIGITVIDLSDEEQLSFYNKKNKINIKSQQGVMISHIISNSGAKESGLKKGDIIIKIDEKNIYNYADLSSIIGGKRPGDKIKIKIIRNKKEMIFFIILKDKEGKVKIRTRKELKSSELLGAKFSILSDSTKSKLSINYGVIISEITEGYLSNLGMEEGDIILSINNKKINKIEDIDKILKGYTGDVTIKWINQYGQIYIRGFEIN